MKDRLISIDVLRGLTIGLMIIVNTPGTWEYVYPPLRHAKWHGLTPTDLVFPFFMFVVGLSMAISFKKFELADKGKWIQKIISRTVLIFAVGLLLNWFPFYHKNIEELRILGVLQRIALSFGGAGLLIILIRNVKYLALTAGGILLGYWALLYFMGGDDPYSLEGNLATAFDPWLLGDKHVYHGFGIAFDPEGLVSTISGIVHVLIGYFVGLNILKFTTDKIGLLKYLLVAGVGLTILGIIWNISFPINKPLWTSSYVLVTTGLGSLLLAFLVWVIDIQGWVKWAYPFRVFGLNPLISYVLSGVFVKLMSTLFKTEDGSLYSLLYHSVFQPAFGNYGGSFAQAIVYTSFIWLFAWGLYRKGKVIKL